MEGMTHDCGERLAECAEQKGHSGRELVSCPAGSLCEGEDALQPLVHAVCDRGIHGKHHAWFDT